MRNCIAAVALCLALSAHACSQGATFDKGAEQAKLQFNAGWESVKEDCAELEFVLESVQDASPANSSPQCLQDGFDAGLQDAYEVAAHSCSSFVTCKDTNVYRQGKNQASTQWDAAWRYTQDCRKLDRVYSQVSNASPSSPTCLRLGFEDGLYEEYEAQLKKCPDACETEGANQAKDVWRHTRNRVGDGCSELDDVFTIVNRAAPSRPSCLNDGYNAQAKKLYNTAMDSCVDECEGNGVALGDRLGAQFCDAVDTFSLNDEGEYSLTLAICDEQEKQACLDEFERYVNTHRTSRGKKCKDSLDDEDNRKFYRDLQKTCKITIGPSSR